MKKLKLPKPFILGLDKNLEKIAEQEGHNERLFTKTDYKLGIEILSDMHKARLENDKAYWESIRI